MQLKLPTVNLLIGDSVALDWIFADVLHIDNLGDIILFEGGLLGVVKRSGTIHERRGSRGWVELSLGTLSIHGTVDITPDPRFSLCYGAFQNTLTPNINSLNNVSQNFTR